jgi:ABC-2 type transport system permease protein
VSRIAAIAWKDLRSTMRNAPALVMMLVAPLALAALLGFAFGGGGDFSIPATKIAVANSDAGSRVGIPGMPGAVNAGTIVTGVMKSPQLKRILTVNEKPTAAAARRAVDDGTAAVAVVIPQDFSDAVLGTSSASRRASVELYENPTQEIGGAVAESVVGGSLLTFDGARAAAVAASGLATANGEGYRAAASAQRAAQAYLAAGGAPTGVDIVQRPPRLPNGASTKDVGVTGAILAGMMVFFMLFGANNVARTILDEDRAGTLPRLFTTPTTRQTILSGKFASVFVTVTVQAVILLIAGRLIFSIEWGRLDAVAALTLVAAAVASGLALLVISMVRTPAQAGAIGAGVYLVLALLGGNFTGTAATTGAYADVQKLTPNGWLLQGWDTAMRGGSLADIALDLLVPLLFAVVFFAAAVFRFRRRYA